MPDFAKICEQVRPHLVLTSGGSEDLWLWEHATRVMQLARYLCKVPELASDPPDETAALLATYKKQFGARRFNALVTELQDFQSASSRT